LARLYADENFPLPAVEGLRRLGHDVLTSREAALAGLAIPDEEVLAASMSIIRREIPDDTDSIRAVNCQAFGREEEGRLVDLLRDGGYARLSLVAVLDGEIVGHIMFSDLPIVTTSDVVPALALAPLAVIPEHQRRGIGSQLVREGVRACRNSGHRLVIVLGAPEFYARFGFSAQLAEHLRSPYAGPNFMALELEPGALVGIDGDVRYQAPFETC
jgi:putative acetyltransferase